MNRKAGQPVRSGSGESGSEVYILKIYRRDPIAAHPMIGTIEDLEGKDKGVFKTGFELMTWLANRRKDIDAGVENI